MSNLYLVHHGIKGQRWGIRRYQNPDGTLTEAGKKRYRLSADGSLQKLTTQEKKVAKQDAVRQAKQQAVDDYVSGKKQKFFARVSARNQIFDTEYDAKNEFDETEEGKALNKEYRDRAERLKTLQNDFYSQMREQSTLSKRFVDQQRHKAQTDFERSSQHLSEAKGKYVYGKLLEKYGSQGVARYMDEGWNMTSKDTGEEYVNWYIRELNEQYTYYWD